MVPQTTTYAGELRCRVTHGPSGVELVTDAPKDNRGRGESFSPTDLVVSALASCMVTTAGIAAQNANVSLDGTKIYAEKHMSPDPPRRIARIVVRVEVCAGVPASFRPLLEEKCRTCPVAQSINPNIILDLTLTYPD